MNRNLSNCEKARKKGFRGFEIKNTDKTRKGPIVWCDNAILDIKVRKIVYTLKPVSKISILSEYSEALIPVFAQTFFKMGRIINSTIT